MSTCKNDALTAPTLLIVRRFSPRESQLGHAPRHSPRVALRSWDKKDLPECEPREVLNEKFELETLPFVQHKNPANLVGLETNKTFVDA